MSLSEQRTSDNSPIDISFVYIGYHFMSRFLIVHSYCLGLLVLVGCAQQPLASNPPTELNSTGIKVTIDTSSNPSNSEGFPDDNEDDFATTSPSPKSLTELFWSDVKPWQKGRLARDHMKPNGPINGAAGFALKTYLSKEGSRGGNGVGGGGCGCN